MTSKRLLEHLYNASQIGIISKENGKVLKDYYKVVLRDLNRLEKLEEENASLHTEIESLHTEIESLHTKCESLHTKIKSVSSETEEQFKKFLDKENQKHKKVIEILKEKLDIKIEFYHNAGYMLNYKVTHNCMISHERCLHYLEVEEGGLLKEYL